MQRSGARGEQRPHHRGGVAVAEKGAVEDDVEADAGLRHRLHTLHLIALIPLI